MNKLAYKIRIAANTLSLSLLAWQSEPLVITSNYLTYLNYINEKYLNHDMLTARQRELPPDARATTARAWGSSKDVTCARSRSSASWRMWRARARPWAVPERSRAVMDTSRCAVKF